MGKKAVKKERKRRKKALRKGTEWHRRRQAEVDRLCLGALALPVRILEPKSCRGALVYVTPLAQSAERS